MLRMLRQAVICTVQQAARFVGRVEAERSIGCGYQRAARGSKLKITHT